MVMVASLQACGVVFPFAMPTSICRSIVTICSGLYLLIGMTRFSSKWILSHSTWYKFPRSRHPESADFSSEIMIHFAGKHVDNPGVLVFPSIAVCLDCGVSEF